MKNIQFNTKVLYDNGIIKGEGIIIGKSHVDMPIIGEGYIVKDLSPDIQKEASPFMVG